MSFVIFLVVAGALVWAGTRVVKSRRQAQGGGSGDTTETTPRGPRLDTKRPVQ